MAGGVHVSWTPYVVSKDYAVAVIEFRDGLGHAFTERLSLQVTQEEFMRRVASLAEAAPDASWTDALVEGQAIDQRLLPDVSNDVVKA
jgi:hypothetical protein